MSIYATFVFRKSDLIIAPPPPQTSPEAGVLTSVPDGALSDLSEEDRGGRGIPAVGAGSPTMQIASPPEEKAASEEPVPEAVPAPERKRRRLRKVQGTPELPAAVGEEELAEGMEAVAGGVGKTESVARGGGKTRRGKLRKAGAKVGAGGALARILSEAGVVAQVPDNLADVEVGKVKDGAGDRETGKDVDGVQGIGGAAFPEGPKEAVDVPDEGRSGEKALKKSGFKKGGKKGGLRVTVVQAAEAKLSGRESPGSRETPRRSEMVAVLALAAPDETLTGWEKVPGGPMEARGGAEMEKAVSKKGGKTKGGRLLKTGKAMGGRLEVGRGLESEEAGGKQDGVGGVPESAKAAGKKVKNPKAGPVPRVAAGGGGGATPERRSSRGRKKQDEVPKAEVEIGLRTGVAADVTGEAALEANVPDLTEKQSGLAVHIAVGGKAEGPLSGRFGPGPAAHFPPAEFSLPEEWFTEEEGRRNRKISIKVPSEEGAPQKVIEAQIDEWGVRMARAASIEREIEAAQKEAEEKGESEFLTGGVKGGGAEMGEKRGGVQSKGKGGEKVKGELAGKSVAGVKGRKGAMERGRGANTKQEAGTSLGLDTVNDERERGAAQTEGAVLRGAGLDARRGVSLELPAPGGKSKKGKGKTPKGGGKKAAGHGEGDMATGQEGGPAVAPVADAGLQGPIEKGARAHFLPSDSLTAADKQSGDAFMAVGQRDTVPNRRTRLRKVGKSAENALEEGAATGSREALESAMRGGVDDEAVFGVAYTKGAKKKGTGVKQDAFPGGLARLDATSNEALQRESVLPGKKRPGRGGRTLAGEMEEPVGADGGSLRTPKAVSDEPGYAQAAAAVNEADGVRTEDSGRTLVRRVSTRRGAGEQSHLLELDMGLPSPEYKRKKGANQGGQKKGEEKGGGELSPLPKAEPVGKQGGGGLDMGLSSPEYKRKKGANQGGGKRNESGEGKSGRELSTLGETEPAGKQGGGNERSGLPESAGRQARGGEAVSAALEAEPAEKPGGGEQPSAEAGRQGASKQLVDEPGVRTIREMEQPGGVGHTAVSQAEPRGEPGVGTSRGMELAGKERDPGVDVTQEADLAGQENQPDSELGLGISSDAEATGRERGVMQTRVEPPGSASEDRELAAADPLHSSVNMQEREGQGAIGEEKEKEVAGTSGGFRDGEMNVVRMDEEDASIVRGASFVGVSKTKEDADGACAGIDISKGRSEQVEGQSRAAKESEADTVHADCVVLQCAPEGISSGACESKQDDEARVKENGAESEASLMRQA
jgi:hypothetical protein